MAESAARARADWREIYALPCALAVLLVWTALIVPGPRASVEMAGQGIHGQFVLAAVFPLLACAVFRWRDIGFRRPDPRWSRLVWMPLLYFVPMVCIALLLGPPSSAVIAVLAVNTLLIGFAEEVMFRGILLSALRGRMGIWPAVILGAGLFAAAHMVHGLVTGAFGAATAQACAAFLSGVFFTAIRLRSGSLYPGVLIHAVWDFAIFFLIAAGSEAAGTAPGSAPTLVPVVFELPLALYGLYLMRNIGREPAPA